MIPFLSSALRNIILWTLLNRVSIETVDQWSLGTPHVENGIVTTNMLYVVITS